MGRSDTTKRLQPNLGGSRGVRDIADTAPSDITFEEVSDAGSPPDGQVVDLALPRTGSFIGQYQLIRQLGAGGMSAVFLARDTRLGRLVALKFLMDCRTELTSRFLDEARATARCNHENIVVIHDVGEHKGRPFMALEFLTGLSLREWLREQIGPMTRQGVRSGTPLSPARAVEIMIPVVRALVRAHEMGIIHRDLKPDNVMLTESGNLKVLDFGIAKFLSQPTLDDPADRTSDEPVPRAITEPQGSGPLYPPARHQTGPGIRIGTLPYMSPEQINGEALDHRTDIWACGIMLYEMVAGRHPLAPLTKRGLIVAASEIDRPMPAVKDHAANIGRIAAVIDRCLLKGKDDRTATASELLAELEALQPDRHRTAHGASQGDETSPFAGLAAFQESNADRFFGRHGEVASAVARLRHQPLLAIVGPSGAGKSSLVRAGIIPALKRSGEGWDAHIIRPGRHPVAALAGLLEAPAPMQTTGPSSRGDGQGDHFTALDALHSFADETVVWQRLQNEPGYVGAVLRAQASKKLRHTLIFVDQFEELYTLGADARERNAFIACLEAIADDASSPLRVVISMRSDFLDHMAEDRALSNSVLGGLVFLPPIGRDGLRQALLRPVEAEGYRFETPTLVEAMLDQLESTQGALPLLQFTAATLWDKRDPGRRLLLQSSYEELGGVAGALATHADAVLAGMSSSDQLLTRTILERLVTPEGTRAIVSMNELLTCSPRSASIERVVDHLASARLVVVETPSGDQGAMVELIHESLISGWPKLSRWLNEHREDATFLARLRAAAKQWQASDRAEGMLWRGEPAQDAERWHSRYRGELPALERDYLGAVLTLATRAIRRKRRIIATSIVLLVGLVIAAAVALLWIRSAEQTVKAQLLQLQHKELELRTTAERAEAATQEAEMTKEQLRGVLRKERVAKKQAQAAAVSARKARDEAREAEKEAREALERERRTKENLRRYTAMGPHKTRNGIRFNYRPRGRPRQVYLAGTFNNWSPSDDHSLKDNDGDGVYSVTVSLAPGSYQYKFVVDGAWVRDPNAPMSSPDGYGGLNGVIKVE